MLQLNKYGFITDFLVSGCLENDFISDIADKNQLNYEKTLRSVVADHNKNMPTGAIGIGTKDNLGFSWNYYYSYDSWFVDQSKFYSLLKKVEFHGATVLVAPQDMEVTGWIWSYAAVDVWVEGTYVGGIDTPVYKPIARKVITFSLKKGENLIYIRLQNLGVRDTRNLFGIQIIGEEKNQLRVSLPDMAQAESCVEAGRWLSSVSLKNNFLNFSSPAPKDSFIIYDSRPIDFTKFGNRYTKEEVSGKTSVKLQSDKPYFKVEVIANHQKLNRSFERQELIEPSYTEETNQRENEKRIFERIASVGQIPRGDTESFSMYPILARYENGQSLPEDEQEILKSLDQIESRRDCSDFLTCAMVRFMKLYPMGEKLAGRCKEVMLNYRYWMDEVGADGMCFWSENHSLMFFVSAYIGGDTYPEDIFTRSGKSGREMKKQARTRIFDWMTDVCSTGFDEFHSGGYTPITFAAILNVIDFADEELSALAWKTADRLLKDLAMQTFHGTSISPMGRVYREVLYPYSQDIQCLINLLNPQAPDRFSEWIIFLETSKYRLPKNLDSLMKEPLSTYYNESNARICIEKQNDYMLTSVQSKRQEKTERSWKNISSEPDADMGSFHYVKSLNECFHGTTQFEPGVFGYQQHMWYAALDVDTCIFVNHPGGSCEGCTTRPGYWFGNGIMPALMQKENCLYAIYQIPDTHPIPFTHLYWPKNRFEEQVRSGNWLAGRKKGGYAAIWCSEELIPHDDMIFDCELRADSRNAAYICICGSKKDYPSLQLFLEECEKKKPVYEKKTGKLTAGKDVLIYEKCENKTQYI